MKKYFLSVLTITLFAIGFAASDEDKSSEQSQSTEQTQTQPQETEAERQEREKQEKVKKVADIAYKKGYEKRMSTTEMISSESSAYMEYTIRYGIDPDSEKSKERWKVFLNSYQKGFSDAADELRKKINSEEF